MEVDGSKLEKNFHNLREILLSKKSDQEDFTLNLSSERSQFTRFNQGKVRQTGVVYDGSVNLTLMADNRSGFCHFPFTGNWEIDREVACQNLEELREEISMLPVDPYIVLPGGEGNIREIHRGELLAPEKVPDSILTSLENLDFTGMYAGGMIMRGYGDSRGKSHWFATDSFNLDYSLIIAPKKAVKATFAGREWKQPAYINKIADGKKQLSLLSREPRKLPRGKYRTYFAPGAVAELLDMLSWGAISESSIQQGNSALAPLSRGEKQLSPKFNLKENFSAGLTPRFNSLGEISPQELTLIENGGLVNSLVNSRTAKEYNKVSNAANSSETLRSPEIKMGNLDFGDILATLGTGLYVSNLHYLNWSNRQTGRITGMTRYACFWVEDGEMVAPIENLRFDESLYDFWGEKLVDFTNFQDLIPEVGTYTKRQLGGSLVPGMLVEDFSYSF
ncbi:TldD/PmbA family protein [Cylindrospermopsis raciborskii]|uniref:TldD/PmbA family protein n=1 Tax=Cylindrospermopsis raciborskii TaxID=77022 RepID=UPI0038D18ADC